jgi:hypothetical protein
MFVNLSMNALAGNLVRDPLTEPLQPLVVAQSVCFRCGRLDLCDPFSSHSALGR